MNMINKCFILLFAVFISLPCHAQNNDEDYAQNNDEASIRMTPQVNEEMSNALNQMGQVMSEHLVPTMVDTMDNVVAEMIRMMAPALISLEENKKLPVADAEMADKIKSAINEKYNQETSYIIDKDTNSIEFDGRYEKTDTVLRYRIVRSLSMSVIAHDVIKKEGVFAVDLASNISSDAVDVKQIMTISDIDDEKVDINKIKINKINGHDYAGYSNKSDKQIYLFTNVGAYIMLHIKVKGEDYAKVAQEFIYSLDYNALRKATNDDMRDIEDIKKMIDELSKDPNKIDKLFEQQSQVQE